MAQRLAVFLQAQNPHLCGRKGMHPGNDTRAFAVLIRLIESSSDSGGIDQSGLENHFEGKPAGSVQPFHDFGGMLCHFSQTFLSIQILGTCTEPEFVVSSCFHFTFPPE